MIGKIIKNGLVEHESTANGFCYKNTKAFNKKLKEVCYVPEYEEKLCLGFSYPHFLRIAKSFMNTDCHIKSYCRKTGTKAHDIARDLFESVDWQSPYALIDDWINSGAYTYSDEEELLLTSNVLNETQAYRLIGEALGIELDGDSPVFREIEEFIINKLHSM